MKSSSLSSLFFTLSLILFISHSPSAKANAASSEGKLIASVCESPSVGDRATCMQLLSADPKVSSAKDYFELSKAILTVASKRGTEGQKFLKELAKKNPSPALQQCANFEYDGVVASFRMALVGITEDTMTANYDAKVASDGPAGCNRLLADEKINNPAISTLNKEITVLSFAAFEATNHLPPSVVPDE